MLKDFEVYTKKQTLGNNSTQWEKRYDNGMIARTVVDNVGLTRDLVREAFKAQEAGVVIGCFQTKDLETWHEAL